MDVSKTTVLVWCLTIFAALGGFLFGYDTGIINGVKDMNGFRDTFNLSRVGVNSTASTREQFIIGLVVSVFSLGCLTGALCSSILSEYLGRKYSIMVGAVVFVAGAIIQAAAFQLWAIFGGRILSGVGVGVLSMVVPLYNAEIAPKRLRGRLVALNQLAITAGIMVSFLVALALADVDHGWRVALALQSLLGSTLAVGMIFLPKSPRWLVKRGKYSNAETVLKKIRKENEIEEELKEIEEDIVSSPVLGLKGTLREMCTRKVLVRLTIGALVQLLQQSTGINVIMYYSTNIFTIIGVAGYISTAIVGITNFLTTFLAIVLVDRVGRKLLLLWGAAGMFLGTLSAGVLVASALGDSSGDRASSSPAQVAAGYFVVLLVLFYVFSFAYSWGPVAWVVTSEIFPLNIRGTAMSITTAANWIGNFTIAMATPLLLGSNWGGMPGTAGTFFLLSVFVAIAFLFVLLVLPETKGKSLEAISNLFELPWLQRIGILDYFRCCPKVRTYLYVRLSPQQGATVTYTRSEDDQNSLADDAVDLIPNESDTED